MKTILSFLLFFTMYSAVAQMEIYSSLTIPDSLIKDADVVVRDEKWKFSIYDINNSEFEVHDVYTLLNEHAAYLLNFQGRSDKFQQLENAEIIVYDALGLKQKTYHKKDMQNQADNDDLVPEGKITYLKITPLSYPFTVEINYSIQYKGLFQYPSDCFQNPYQSIQKEILDVEAPTNLLFRYKILNCNYQPTITHNGDKDFYHWEVKNLKAFKIEKHVGSTDNYLPQVILAPNKFKMGEYEGDMTSWKNFGAWNYNLYKDRMELSDERKLFYQGLVKDAKNDKEKAKILYNYLQNNMRYVSIQLGIGGWQPFKASFVDEKKYGDCKALSNYMKTVLAAVGIKSNVVIIQGAVTPKTVFEDFPANYFNHAILCIPNNTDTTWLECTSTTKPFAQLGPFTENRKAMMVTDNGGVLVNTPKSNYKDNTQSFYTNINFAEDSATMVTTNYISTGAERNILVNYFHDEKEDEKRKIFIYQLQWKQPDFIDITTSATKENPYIINTKMGYEKVYSFKTSSKYFLQPRLYPIFEEDIPETQNRKLDYYFTYPHQTIDTTVYHFSSSFSVENLPKNKNIQTDFGLYKCTYVWDASTHTVVTMALLQLKERIIKATDYQNLLNFKNAVLADVNEKIVMKKE